MRFLVTVFLSSALLTVYAQPQQIVVADVRSDWKVHEGMSWLPYDQRTEEPHSVYFSINAQKFKGSRLEVNGPIDYSLWVNGMIIGQAKKAPLSLSLDSLALRYSVPLEFAIHADEPVQYMSTNLTMLSANGLDNDLARRRADYMRDFAIIAVVLLFAFFILLLQFNPRITMDYFNVIRLFTLQERDETQVTGRITSRFSFLVYALLGLWCALLLLIIFNHSGQGKVMYNSFAVYGVAGAFFNWGKLTAIIFVMLFLKVCLVLLLAGAFRFREGAAIQVLNYFRLLTFLLMVLSLVLTSYFIFGTKNPHYYENLIYLTGWVLGVWAILIFFKLLNRSAYSVFHLFSYLCASEFFPIIILFKVLFF